MMQLLDIRTILLSGIITTFICAIVAYFLWIRSRDHFPGLGYWVGYSTLQCVGVTLMALRGFIPDVLSLVMANACIMGGAIPALRGLQYFVGRKWSLIPSAVLWVVFITIHTYFWIVTPNLMVRSLNIAVFLLIMFAQCTWVSLVRVPAELRDSLRPMAIICGLFAVVNLVRIPIEFLSPENNDYMHAGSSQSFILILYQMLYLSLTFALTLLVNRRLVLSVQSDLEERTKLEQVMEEHASHYRTLANSGQALIWTSGTDTLCDWFNDTWLEFTGKNIEDEIGNGWAKGVHPEDFERCVQTYLSAFERREKFSMDYRLRHHDGEYRWLQDDGSPRFNLRGEFIGYIGHCLDVTDRKHTEEKLRQTETHLRRAQEIAKLGSWTYRQDGRVTWSEELYHVYGRDTGTFVLNAETLIESVHPEDQSTLQEWMESCFAGDRLTELQFRAIRPDGTIVYISAMGERVVGDGDDVYLEGTAQDVTERVLAEVQLRASEERFRTAMDSMIEGAQIISHDWTYLYQNAASERLNRRSNAEMMGRRIMDLWPNFESTSIYEQLRTCMIERRPIQHECRFTFPDGDVGWFDFSIQPIPEGVFVLSVDISEQKRADAALARNTERLRYLHEIDQRLLEGTPSRDQILEHCLHAVGTVLETEGAVLYRWSPKRDHVLAHVLGGDKDRVHVQHCPDRLHDNLFWESSRNGAFEQVRRVDRVELAQMNFPWMPEWTTALVSPLMSESMLIGALVIGWLDERSISSEEEEIAMEFARQAAVVMEQTRLREESRRHAEDLEKRVRERTVELESANRELESFVYSVSHDLRAPLRGLDGFSRILVQEYGPRLDAEVLHICEVIHSSAQRMNQLLDDLLKFSRLGRSALQRMPIDMEEVVLQAYEEATTREEREKIAFHVDSLAMIEGDRALLFQVWANLIGNAVKFTSRADSPRIDISSRREEGRMVFVIHDNGAGFDMRYADKLFGVFQRLHSGSEFPGTGLGLAIVQRIIHRHGGEVWAEGEVGRGATFSFSLPLD